MLNQLHQMLAKLRTLRRQQGVAQRVRPSVERLEQRMMLSASYGGYGSISHAGGGIGQHGGSGPPHPNSTSSTHHSVYSGGFDGQSLKGIRDFPSNFGGIQDRPPMRGNVGPRSEMHPLDRRG